MLKTTITMNRNERFRYEDLTDDLYTYVRVCLYKDGFKYEYICEGHRGYKDDVSSNFPEPEAAYINEILRRHGLPMVVCSALETLEYVYNL